MNLFLKGFSRHLVMLFLFLSSITTHSDVPFSCRNTIMPHSVEKSIFSIVVICIAWVASVESVSVQQRTIPSPFFNVGSNSSITLYLSDVPPNLHDITSWNVSFDLCAPDSSPCEILPRKVADILRCSRSTSRFYSSAESIFVCQFDTEVDIMERELIRYLSHEFRVTLDLGQGISTTTLLPLVLHPREWTFSVKIDNL
jgi:hypothetical protein